MNVPGIVWMRTILVIAVIGKAYCHCILATGCSVFPGVFNHIGKQIMKNINHHIVKTCK
jgi:hypothetical protein